jgi:histidinol-phosphatase (PHP family)
MTSLPPDNHVHSQFSWDAPTGSMEATCERAVRIGLPALDYPVRKWPADARPFDPFDFEEEYRHVLRLLAHAGKALEVNTKVPLHPQILTWWREDGGQAIAFASDAHSPDRLAAGFAEAVRVAEAAGFGAGDDPLGLWYRA